jgi:hypothetical protein
MSQFRRILFNIMTGLSLLICLSMSALWVRSYMFTDAVERQGPRRMWQTVSSAGQVYFAAQVAASPSAVYAPTEEFFHYRSPPGQPLPWTASAGYENYVNTGPFTLARSHAPDWNTLVVRVPHWFVFGLAAVLPVTRLLLRRKRRLPGCCASCGYDLRATPDKCPECGTVVAKAASDSWPVGIKKPVE